MFADLATGASCLVIVIAYALAMTRYANRKDREISAEQRAAGLETDSYLITSRPAPWLAKKYSN